MYRGGRLVSGWDTTAFLVANKAEMEAKVHCGIYRKNLQNKTRFIRFIESGFYEIEEFQNERIKTEDRKMLL